MRYFWHAIQLLAAAFCVGAVIVQAIAEWRAGNDVSLFQVVFAAAFMGYIGAVMVTVIPYHIERLIGLLNRRRQIKRERFLSRRANRPGAGEYVVQIAEDDVAVRGSRHDLGRAPDSARIARRH